MEYYWDHNVPFHLVIDKRF